MSPFSDPGISAKPPFWHGALKRPTVPLVGDGALDMRAGRKVKKSGLAFTPRKQGRTRVFTRGRLGIFLMTPQNPCIKSFLGRLALPSTQGAISSQHFGVAFGNQGLWLGMG
ncbi:MAG: hypothetical protein CM15mP68_4560 [Pseudomonadota bacterium]|nr:MAG: hypothetical protein CM15mP68_4560 [Pseudomonadota bacterium]